MRTTLVCMLLLSVGCAEPKPPASPEPPNAGACDDGALLGKASETGRVACEKGKACVLAANGPRCVSVAEAELPEPCGQITCGAGCSCASTERNECLCPTLGGASR